MRNIRRCFCSVSPLRDFLASPPELVRLSTVPNSLSPDTAARVNELIKLSESVHQLRLKRVETLSLPAHSVQGRNKELMALGVGAVSGALSLSFHPAFAIIFFFSYRMYRRANEPTRVRLSAPERVKEINSEISDKNSKIEKIRKQLENELE